MTTAIDTPQKLHTPPRDRGPEEHFQSTIDCRIVHRRSLAEVFVTGVEPAGGDAVRIFAQWPRGNRFHLSTDGRRFDEMLVMETFRQSAIAAAHLLDGVPLGTRFVMTAASLDFEPCGLSLRGAPGEVRIDLRRSWERRRSELAVSVSLDGVRVATGAGELLALDAATYTRLRGVPELLASDAARETASTRAPRPSSVGRFFPEDVLVRRVDGSDTLTLAVNPAHPVYFDHTHDHVPGMLLMDAARQACWLSHRRLATAGPVALRAIRARFHQFVELGAACAVRMSERTGADGARIVDADFCQGGASRSVVRLIVD